jgi:S-DNA-T family DNA segregation ATPase FtsK/SpoIIIE
MPRLTAAVARAIAAQLAWALSPRDNWIEAPPGERQWTTLLPHQAHPTRGVGAQGVDVRLEGYRFGRVAGRDPDIVVATAERRADLPSECAVVIDTATNSGPAIVQHPDRSERREITLELLSQEEAAIWAESARTDAEREGLVGRAHEVPESVSLGELLTRPPDAGASSRSALTARFCVGARGPVEIDLVAHGPHAVIGGTTGSGKSELLVSWVLALAATHPPELVTFLLVDFKGGAAFAALALLPHTVGLVTDLDVSGAQRALSSLKAELGFRERALADARVGDIRDGSALPRLVIVVDEFATMLNEHPELHGVFVDIAARGRSLGVHLVLCTQRPAGVVRDSVLANADVRISLRVNNPADSDSVVGTSEAARIPAHPRGRAVIRLAGGAPEHVQIARATDEDVARISTEYPATALVRKPWCEPLSTRIPIDSLPPLAPNPGPDGGVRDASRVPQRLAFGLLDLPHEQRIDIAEWIPNTAAHVLVVGASRSGKTTTLETIASRSTQARWVPQSPDAAWDLVSRLASDLSEPAVLLVDDLDSLLARFPADYRAALVERLARVLRDGPAHGIHIVASAQRITADAAPLASLMPERLMLSHTTRHDWVLAGGESSGFTGALPPGGGVWRGDRVQVAFGAPPRPVDELVAVADVAPDRPLAIVSPRSRAFATRLGRVGRVVELGDIVGDVVAEFDGRNSLGLGARGSERRIVIGDVDEWQSRWGALLALRDRADLVFDSCSVADYRALSRSRELPPLISEQHAVDRAVCWRLMTDGRAERVRLELN